VRLGIVRYIQKPGEPVPMASMLLIRACTRSLSTSSIRNLSHCRVRQLSSNPPSSSGAGAKKAEDILNHEADSAKKNVTSFYVISGH